MKDQANETTKNSGKLIGAGALTAVVASLCCIVPVLAFLAGASGIASAFSWLDPVRPYLIAFTVLLLSFTWYQKLKPKTAEEIQCFCDEDEKHNFWQTKTFLGIVTVFTALMLAFPNYAHIFYPSNDRKEVLVVNSSDIHTVTFDIKGMTCNGCASHIENVVNKLPGILSVEVSYENAFAKVAFDQSKVSLAEIEETINATGYTIKEIQR